MQASNVSRVILFSRRKITVKILIEEKFIAAYHRAAHRVFTIHFLFPLPRQLHLRLFTRETLSCKISIFIYFDANIYINELKEIILHVSLFLLLFFFWISLKIKYRTQFSRTLQFSKTRWKSLTWPLFVKGSSRNRMIPRRSSTPWEPIRDIT